MDFKVGNPVPIIPIPLDPGMFFYVEVFAFQNPLPGCEGTAYYLDCCYRGDLLNYWAENRQCDNGWEACVFTGYSAQRLIGVQGPYSSMRECFDAHW
jgi:hypothetical protein